MTLATTYFSTSNASTEGRLTVEVDDIMWHIGEPTDTPLIALTGGKLYKKGSDTPEEVAGKIRKQLSDQVDFKVIEKDALTRVLTVSTANTSTSTTTVVTSSNSAAKVGDILINKTTRERMFVTAVDSGGANLSCNRNLGSTPFTIAAGAKLKILGSGFAQGTSKASIRSILGASRTRYCQIFKRTFGITRTLAAAQLETKVAALDEEQQQAYVEINKDIENAFWLNAAADSSTDTNSATVYLTRGIDAELDPPTGTNYRTNCAGNMNEDFFRTTLAEECFQYGPSRKALFVDAKFASRIGGFAWVKQETRPEMTKYGLRIRELETQHGTFEMINCGAISDALSSDQQGIAYVVDLDRVIYKHMAKRDVTMEMDIQTPGDDVIEGQYYCEIGLSLKSLAHHRKIYNIG